MLNKTKRPQVRDTMTYQNHKTNLTHFLVKINLKNKHINLEKVQLIGLVNTVVKK